VPDAGPRLYHLALAADWERAKTCGEYTVSTRGATLAEVGYIHLSRADQVAGVAERFYRDLSDVLLLEVDPSRLDAPVVDEAVGTETFPHLYGPLPVTAVCDVVPYVPA
jgi:glutathione S-transferase